MSIKEKKLEAEIDLLIAKANYYTTLTNKLKADDNLLVEMKKSYSTLLNTIGQNVSKDTH